MSEKPGSWYALLGMLSEGNMSGYEIRQRLEQGTANFWTESYGQIYPQLKLLSDAGMITKIASEQQEGRPERHIYQITATGLQELREWLGRKVTIRPIRNELLLKLYFAAEMDSATIVRHIAQHAETMQMRLQKLDGLERMIHSLPLSAEKKRGWLLTLSYGKHSAQAALTWCEEASLVIS